MSICLFLFLLDIMATLTLSILLFWSLRTAMIDLNQLTTFWWRRNILMKKKTLFHHHCWSFIVQIKKSLVSQGQSGLLLSLLPKNNYLISLDTLRELQSRQLMSLFSLGWCLSLQSQSDPPGCSLPLLFLKVLWPWTIWAKNPRSSCN